MAARKLLYVSGLTTCKYGNRINPETYLLKLYQHVNVQLSSCVSICCKNSFSRQYLLTGVLRSAVEASNGKLKFKCQYTLWRHGDTLHLNERRQCKLHIICKSEAESRARCRSFLLHQHVFVQRSFLSCRLIPNKENCLLTQEKVSEEKLQIYSK